ncbi:MAG: SUMF1/EgtB/PvdO family nonheme iron enzyme, partial [Deltaproteobacteria bacterium]|nr:SUMF1/EgtB/PvdO family nonheme iron enzyme [Deltaproteobacteria bacterium]
YDTGADSGSGDFGTDMGVYDTGADSGSGDFGTDVGFDAGCTPDCVGKCGGPDRCGGTCPDSCIAPETCGGGGVQSICGFIPTCGPSPSGKGGDMCDIPAGAFWMGCNVAVDKECSNDEKPYHEVTVPNFKIDKYEVSAGEYGECVSAGVCTGADTEGKCNYHAAGKDNHPVNCVDWDQAKAYCAWAGKRLPSEAEWEKVARGADGRKYPWGNTGLDCDHAVTSVSPCSASGTAAVGSKPTGASLYGTMDAIGNVWEWVHDDYHPSYYGAPANGRAWTDDPRGTYRVLRGGGWYYGDADSLRSSRRVGFHPSYRTDYLGFRCAWPCVADCSGKCGGDDGCGGTCLDNCDLPQTCGGGGTENVCGCTPDCAGKCGGDDGCGGKCPDNCVAPDTCGGGGTQNVCGNPFVCGPSPSGKGGSMCDVPPGAFQMGCNSAVDNECEIDEIPGHQVVVAEFKIDKYEVTVLDYVACVTAGECTAAGTGGGCNFGVAPRENTPTNCVDWNQAKAYCAWAGKRLPTEAEWEKAARGMDGRKYPWGNDPLDCNHAVHSANGCNYPGTAPVGSKPAGVSPYGAEDMIGNVFEWVEDDWPSSYYTTPVDGSAWLDNPRASKRAMRGGGWYYSYTRDLRASERNGSDLTDTFFDIGFRCAWNCIPACGGNCGGDDGCGGTCPDNCVLPETCGGGGSQNVCGCSMPDCSGKCGGAADGCGGICPDPCDGHGTCNAGACTCDAGYTGTLCDVCETGYTGYPNCVRTPVCGPSPTGKGGDMCDVPAGAFMMGCNTDVDTECYGDGREDPYHSVTVPAFKIDKYEVTASEYKACVTASGCNAANTGSGCNYNVAGKESHPINCVDWNQAKAYCTWAGKKLATEAEWEKAARGMDGRKYPWGNDVLDCNRAVHSVSPCSNSGTATVGSKPTGVSPCGAMDMVGNVWEWVEDDYHSSYTGAPANGSAWVDGPRGSYRVLRGGGWNDIGGGAENLRASGRGPDNPTFRYDFDGFRCSRDGS